MNKGLGMRLACTIPYIANLDCHELRVASLTALAPPPIKPIAAEL